MHFPYNSWHCEILCERRFTFVICGVILIFTSDDLVPDGQSDLYSLPPDSQSEIVEEDDVVNPYPITFPVRKISVPTKLVSKEKKNEEKTG